jgi:hypothetical protein
MSSHSRRISAPERDGEGGFSLLELVVVTSLLMLVLGVVTTGFISVQRSERFTQGRVKSLDALENTLARMTKDLRQTTSVDPSSTTSRLVVQTYVQGVSHEVMFEVDGSGDLIRSVDGSGGLLMQEGVLDPNVFTLLPSVDDAESVEIDLLLRPEALPDTEMGVEGEVQFRNRETS